MWLDSRGVMHVEALGDPTLAFSDALVSRVQASTRGEVNSAIRAVKEYMGELFDEVDSSDDQTLKGGGYGGIPLPDGMKLDGRSEDTDLSDLLLTELRSAPLRWRPDLVASSISALYKMRPSIFAETRRLLSIWCPWCPWWPAR